MISIDLNDETHALLVIIIICILVYIVVIIKGTKALSLFTCMIILIKIVFKGTLNHNWFLDLPEHPVFCNICEKIMLPKEEGNLQVNKIEIVRCYFCSSYSHNYCKNKIQYSCKPISAKVMEHYWYK